MLRRPESPSNGIYYLDVSPFQVPTGSSFAIYRPLGGSAEPCRASRSGEFKNMVSFSLQEAPPRHRANYFARCVWAGLHKIMGSTIVLLCLSDTSTFWALSQLCMLHPLVDEWLELSPKIRNMEHIFAYEGRLVMYGSLAIPSEAI